MKLRKVLICLGVLYVPVLLAGVNNNPSAAAAALSDAVTADTIGVRGVRYNPAGLGFLRDWESEFSHLPWAFDMASEGLGYAAPVGRMGGFGISAVIFHSLFDAENFIYEQGSAAGRLNDADYSLTAAWGRSVLRDRLAAGVSAEARDRSAGGEHSFSFGCGAGVLYKQHFFPSVFRDAGRGQENFRAGLSVNGLFHQDSSAPVVARAGILFRPWPVIGLLCDLRYAGVAGYYSDFDVLTGAELAWGFRFTRFILRAGYSVLKNKVSLGGGAQTSVGKTIYRFDYAYDLMPDPLVGADLGRASWFSLVIAQNPVLLQLIAARFGSLPESVWNLRDRVLVSSGRDDAAQSDAREVYEIRIEGVTAADSCLAAKSWDKELAAFLGERISGQGNLRLVSTGGQIVLSGTLRREGELMQCVMRQKDPSTGALLMENVFEKTVVCETADAETASALDLMVRREGDRIVIVPRRQGEEHDREIDKLRETASEIGRWVAESARDLLSSTYLVQANYSNVDVYADGVWQARTDSKGRAEVRLQKGRRLVTFTRANTPSLERTLTVAAGKTERLSVTMGEGAFTVPLEILSFSDPLQVSLDGKLLGTTPVRDAKVQNGKHTLTYTDSRGRQFKEEILVDVEGTWRITALTRLNESFAQIDPDFWNTLEPDAGIGVAVRSRKLEIKGKSSDGDWNPSGLVSRPFQAGQVTVECLLRSRSDSSFFVIGLVDGKGEGLGYGLDGRHGQIYETGRNRGLVPGLALRDKGAEQELRLVYRDGTLSVELNGSLLSDRTRRMTGPVRLFLLAGGESPGSEVDIEMRNLVVRNEAR